MNFSSEEMQAKIKRLGSIICGRKNEVVVSDSDVAFS
jgi:hypothetical protein